MEQKTTTGARKRPLDQIMTKTKGATTRGGKPWTPKGWAGGNTKKTPKSLGEKNGETISQGKCTNHTHSPLRGHNRTHQPGPKPTIAEGHCHSVSSTPSHPSPPLFIHLWLTSRGETAADRGRDDHQVETIKHTNTPTQVRRRSCRPFFNLHEETSVHISFDLIIVSRFIFLWCLRK